MKIHLRWRILQVLQVFHVLQVIFTHKQGEDTSQVMDLQLLLSVKRLHIKFYLEGPESRKYEILELLDAFLATIHLLGWLYKALYVTNGN